MEILVYGMIFCGSALMLLNIIQYFRLLRSSGQINALSGNRGIVISPLILLILFLMGYLGVALLGDPQPLVGAILFGGSIFVYLALHLLFYVIHRVHANETRLVAMYEEMRTNLDQYTKDALAVFRVNLSRDRIEERGGKDLYEEDETASSYSDLVQIRIRHMPGIPSEYVRNADRSLFSCRGLLEEFRAGRLTASQIVITKRKSGQICFVRLDASMAVKPGSEEVVAFITERDYNRQMVNDTVLNKALAQQYDMITWLVDGRYGIVIGEADKIRRGNIFPEKRIGEYAAYINGQVAPALRGTPEEKHSILESLSLERVTQNLASREPYEVSLSCEIDGATYYKQFTFFTVDRNAGFFILLKSDTTSAQEEHIRKNLQLEEALQKARAASLAKSAFLSNMSHDIRTPMNAITGFTNLAKSTQDLSQIRTYLDKIDASSQHLLDLINDVLEMSRIESGRMELRETPVDLREVLQEIRELFELQMKERSIDYRVEETGLRDRYVYCDRARLDRILLNLLSNACKFTPEGGRVEVTLVQEQEAVKAQAQKEADSTGSAAARKALETDPEICPADRADYSIHVRDNGIGMNREFAARVFDAFERERNSTVSGIQGTGLGMAITKKIVDLMQGTIEVETAPGEGTEFTVRLRLRKASEKELEKKETHCGQGEEGDFEGMRVLIVDDMAVNREIAAMLLEQMGFFCDTAENGKEAVEKVAASPFCTYQGILMDIQMPVMNGYEACRAIRALPAPYPARIPVIAMSANAFTEDIEASLNAGMDAHVAKPIDLDDLRATLEKVLKPVCREKRALQGKDQHTMRE